MKPENTILTLLSVKKYLCTILDCSDWVDNYNFVIAGNLGDSDKQVNLLVNTDTKIKLPIISIMYGTITTDPYEMGSASGHHKAILRVLIYGVSLNQALSLTEFIKRYLDDTNIDLKDYTSEDETLLGSITTGNVNMFPMMQFGSENTTLEFQHILEVEINFPIEKLLN